MSKTGKVTRRGRWCWRDVRGRVLGVAKTCWVGVRRWVPWRRLALVAAGFVIVMTIWSFALRRAVAPRLLELPERNLAGYPQSPDDPQVSALSRLEAEVTALRKKVSALTNEETKAEKLSFDPSMFQRPALGKVAQGMGWIPTEGEWRYHDGVDILAEEKTHVMAAADGRVTSVKNDPGLGTVVIITHGNGWESRYGHVQGVRVNPGQDVRVGTVLGSCSTRSCGDTGGFHFSIYAKGQPVDPEGIIQGLN